MRDQAREDGQARLLMTAPGVGVIVALTFVATVDDAARFRSSKAATNERADLWQRQSRT